jgi:hypothetical protein
MIVQFRYGGDKILDKEPLAVVLHNEAQYNMGVKKSKSNLIHAINLNYLTDYKVNKLFDLLIDGAGVYSPKGENIILTEDQDETDYDDATPGRNIFKKPYTTIQLPKFRRIREGNPLSKSEAKRQMDVLYNKVLKSFIRFHDVYRTYDVVKMTQLRVVEWNK